MSDDGVLERVQAIVAGIAGADRTPAVVGPDTPLGEDGFWLDSVDMLEVLLACEREFSTSFPANLAGAALATVRSLAEAVRAR
ncbi:MAG TPA: acyl carrier protein [Candidatus Methylomirabilis sp.]|nr:acyl carrier protein [Candidatus Methylomirabilis sp.]